MTDYHVHTTVSPDGKSTYAEYIKRAELIGCKGICFTDHLDLGYAQKQFENPDVLDKRPDFEQLRQNTDITVLRGIEAGYIQHSAEATAELLKSERFDYVINSVHQVDGIDPYFPEYFEHKTRAEAYEKYLQAVYDSLDAPYDYSVVGHLGYVFRNAPYPEPMMEWKEFPDLYDAILMRIIYLGKGLEVNTSALKSSQSPMPCMSVLRRYAELGGEIITLGSDAHEVRRLCDRFETVRQMLLSSGLKYLADFKDMQCTLDYIK